MPKQVYKLNQFHGGLNTNSDPRDIADNELSTATDIMVDELGRIRSIGGAGAHQSETGAAGTHANEIVNGYGLYAWNHDRVDGHTGGSAISATSDAATGENYLAFSDADNTGEVRIYAFSDDTWGNPISGMTNVDGGSRKDVFYSVDGALRVCDSRLTNSNSSKWYGYIDRSLFQSISDTVSTDQWYLAAQNISSPSDDSQFDQAIETVTISTGHSQTNGSISAQFTESTEDVLFDAGVLNMMGGIAVTVTITSDSFSGIPDFDDFLCSFTLTTGSVNISTDAFLGTLGESHKSDDQVEYGVVSSGASRDITYTFSFGDYYHDGSTVGGDFVNGETGFGIRTAISSAVLGDKIDSIELKTVVITEETASDTNSHSVNTAAGGLTISNLHLEAQFAAPDSGTALGWGKVWEHGVSFIYDEKQESLVRRMFDNTASDTTEHDNTGQTTHCPTAKLYVKHGTSSGFNRRITGAVWYIRESSGGGTANDWTAQIEYDFIRGVSKVLSSGYETDCTFNQHAEEYEFEVDQDNLLSPNLVDTYTSRTGVASDEIAIKARYGTSCTVGRRVYVGNVEIEKEDGSKEIKGDAMLKSPVNKFDIFPSLSTIEAAINDGESITALEEFADRILQFKENTLYIINVSQDIEFLEDVLKYKGVAQSSAVCKTDYGIAWVNTLGCYLYDGRKVIDLIEKGGRQIIKDSDWQTFAQYNPMIGYVPKKRQLIVVDDNTPAGSGQIFLYDMVTQSWVKGATATITSQVLTNFVNDVNGDLVWSHTSDTGTMKQWNDASATTTGISFKTKDLDFGQPAIRKKIYKAYVSYKGDGGAITVNYGTDGNSTMAGQFYITGSTGASTKAGAADLCIYDASVGTNDWVLAELIPSSTINNIDSFRLSFDGGTTNADFEINDISVVYRMKNIK